MIRFSVRESEVLKLPFHPQFSLGVNAAEREVFGIGILLVVAVIVDDAAIVWKEGAVLARYVNEHRGVADGRTAPAAIHSKRGDTSSCVLMAEAATVACIHRAKPLRHSVSVVVELIAQVEAAVEFVARLDPFGRSIVGYGRVYA